MASSGTHADSVDNASLSSFTASRVASRAASISEPRPAPRGSSGPPGGGNGGNPGSGPDGSSSGRLGGSSIGSWRLGCGGSFTGGSGTCASLPASVAISGDIQFLLSAAKSVTAPVLKCPLHHRFRSASQCACRIGMGNGGRKHANPNAACWRNSRRWAEGRAVDASAAITGSCNFCIRGFRPHADRRSRLVKATRSRRSAFLSEQREFAAGATWRQLDTRHAPGIVGLVAHELLQNEDMGRWRPPCRTRSSRITSWRVPLHPENGGYR